MTEGALPPPGGDDEGGSDSDGRGAGRLTLMVVRFSAGGHRFAVEAAHVRGLAGAVPADAPRAESVLGLADDGGTDGRRCLLVAPSGGGAPRPLSVAEPVHLDAVAAEAVVPLPPLVAARMSIPGARALALDAEGPVLLLDADALDLRACATGS